MKIIAGKSSLFTTAQRRQSPLHRESLGVNQILQIARPYLLQSKSPNNYIFCDASSISYISRVKPFSNFLQQLADEISQYPGLQVVHAFGRSLSYVDIFSRSLDYVKLERSDTNLSQEQAEIPPSLKHLQTGTIIGNDTLLELLNTTPPAELFDVSESSYNCVQRIPFEKYNSDTQLFTSERDFILGSLESHTPETVFKLAT